MCAVCGVLGFGTGLDRIRGFKNPSCCGTLGLSSGEALKPRYRKGRNPCRTSTSDFSTRLELELHPNALQPNNHENDFRYIQTPQTYKL